MVILLLLSAAFLALMGAANFTVANIGVGLVALACFLGICARIAQAHAQHRAIHGRAPAHAPTPAPSSRQNT